MERGFYSQFAITISVATVFSSINALTLSPALCGLLLRPSPEKRGWFFTLFNRGFDRATESYTAFVRVFVRRVALMMLVFAGFVAATAFGFVTVPGGFLPDEDQGYFFANVKLPDSASLERTEEVLDGITEVLMETPGVADVITVGGYSFLDGIQSSNGGAAIVALEDWSARASPELLLLSIPFSMLGAMLGTFFRDYDNNVYTQIGLVLLIGLSAKTAFLIVEFAKQLREEGKTTHEAAIPAAHSRFRPLLMTAFSFILGVLPLLIATGAGSGSRRALGTAVFSGMVFSTLIGVFLIPVFFVFVQRIRDPKRGSAAATTTATVES